MALPLPKNDPFLDPFLDPAFVDNKFDLERLVDVAEPEDEPGVVGDNDYSQGAVLRRLIAELKTVLASRELGQTCKEGSLPRFEDLELPAPVDPGTSKTDLVGGNGVVPKAGKGRGKPPAGKAPPVPKRKAASGHASASPMSEGALPGSQPTQPKAGKGSGKGGLPAWEGPQPSGDWKAARVVNWHPIRQADRWEGSVWEQVHKKMRQEGFKPLPDSLLNGAFMLNIAEASNLPQQRIVPVGRTVERRLSQQSALTVDILHAHLLRHGIRDPVQLRWATGGPSSSDSSLPQGGDQGCEQSGMLSEDILEALLGLLLAAQGEESRLVEPSTASCDRDIEDLEAPAEVLLQRLLRDVGPLRVLQSRVQMALNIARFPDKVAAVERELKLGLSAAQVVIDSTALPVLFEGALLLGNYVNAGRASLGSAVCVKLESLSNLAHTRCLPTTPQPQRGDFATSLSQPPPPISSAPNALQLLVDHLGTTHGPQFKEDLLADLAGCHAVRDLDPKDLASEVHELGVCVQMVEQRLAGSCSDAEAPSEEPEALHPKRLKEFLAEAKPNIENLRQLMVDFDGAVTALRRWLAEPTKSSFVDMMSGLLGLRAALSSAA